MEGFSFLDIYATKGIEYLLTIAFLSGFLFFAVRFLFRAMEAPMAKEEAGAESVDWFSVPRGLFYHRGHSWLMPEESDTVRVGIDDYARKLVGTLSAVELPEVGANLSQGERAWGIKADGKLIPMLSPVDGRVVEVNQAVLAEPGLIGRDPFGEGWLIKVKASRLSTDVKNLFSGELARQWVESSVNALRIEAGEGASVGATMQDGGIPVDGIARALYGDDWAEKVKEEFLTAD